jgi:hypothetical protein
LDKRRRRPVTFIYTEPARVAFGGAACEFVKQKRPAIGDRGALTV